MTGRVAQASAWAAGRAGYRDIGRAAGRRARCQGGGSPVRCASRNGRARPPTHLRRPFRGQPASGDGSDPIRHRRPAGVVQSDRRRVGATVRPDGVTCRAAAFGCVRTEVRRTGRSSARASGFVQPAATHTRGTARPPQGQEPSGRLPFCAALRLGSGPGSEPAGRCRRSGGDEGRPLAASAARRGWHPTSRNADLGSVRLPRHGRAGGVQRRPIAMATRPRRRLRATPQPDPVASCLGRSRPPSCQDRTLIAGRAAMIRPVTAQSGPAWQGALAGPLPRVVRHVAPRSR